MSPWFPAITTPMCPGLWPEPARPGSPSCPATRRQYPPRRPTCFLFCASGSRSQSSASRPPSPHRHSWRAARSDLRRPEGSGKYLTIAAGAACSASSSSTTRPCAARRRCTSGCSASACFRRRSLQHGAELVLHGHTHQPTVNFINGRDGKVPVVGVSSTSQAPGRSYACRLATICLKFRAGPAPGAAIFSIGQ